MHPDRRTQLGHHRCGLYAVPDHISENQQHVPGGVAQRVEPVATGGGVLCRDQVARRNFGTRQYRHVRRQQGVLHQRGRITHGLISSGHLPRPLLGGNAGTDLLGDVGDDERRTAHRAVRAPLRDSGDVEEMLAGAVAVEVHLDTELRHVEGFPRRVQPVPHADSALTLQFGSELADRHTTDRARVEGAERGITRRQNVLGPFECAKASGRRLKSIAHRFGITD